MKRETQFRAYLLKHGKTLKHITYCKNIEKAFGGKDMDEIISSHKNISNARAKLDAIFPKTSADQYICGLNSYLKFALSATKSVYISPRYHVTRAKGVPLTKEIAQIAYTLEQEYENVIYFAEKLFGQGTFDYIPIIISDEEPRQEGPEDTTKVVGSFFASSKPYIEIYHRNIDPCNAAGIRNCLAHEYLHYLHWCSAGAEYSNASTELKEALADFFAILFSIDRHGSDDLTFAKAQYALWKKNEGSWWPYAYALYFYNVHGSVLRYTSNFSKYHTHGSIGKFIQIFLSSDHPKDALDALLHV